MKTLKVKSILFSLFAMMTVAIFLTSCEQSALVIEEDLETSLINEKSETVYIGNIDNQLTGQKNMETSVDSEAKGNCPTPPSNGLWYYANPNQCTSVSVYSFLNEGYKKQFFLYDSNWNFIAKKTTKTTTAIFTGLQPGKQYFFKVRNICGRGNISSFTGNVWFTVCP